VRSAVVCHHAGAVRSRRGLAAALLFAVYAPAVHYDVVMLRGPWIVLAALLLTWQLVRMPVQPPGRAGVLTGACTGLALLVNEGFVLLPRWSPPAPYCRRRAAGARRC